MIIECPKCHTRFRLDDSLVGPQGSKVKCSKCQHIFKVQPPGFEDDLDTLVQQADGDDGFKPEEKQPEPAAKKEISVEIGGPKPDSTQKGKTKKILLWILIPVLLVTLSGAAVWFGYPLIKPLVQGMFGDEQPPAVNNTVAANKPVETEKIKDIVLENVRQYFVDNEKIGQLFVIEGKAVNKFTGIKELIKLRATLFEAKNKVFQYKDFYAGNIVSLFQLQILSGEELESALNARVGILTNNTNLKPGSDVPFMVVFYNPPENVTEFGLEVIEAKDPPE